MRNLCMKVSYDGTAYNGFQTQPDGNTIQDVIEEALAHLTGETVKITGSGRTDAGVHARGQVFNFYTSSKIPLDRWCLAINSRLPGDILVWQAWEVPEAFHARRSAKCKTYRYTIRCGKHPDLFKRHQEYHHYMPLDTDAMRDGLRHVVGEHDFTSFCSTRTDKKSNVRTIYSAKLECGDWDAHLESYPLYVYLTGNGFLYNMVRIIVGTLLEVGMGKRKSEEIVRILEGRSRLLAGPTAMAHGLMLWDVEYGLPAGVGQQDHF